LEGSVFYRTTASDNDDLGTVAAHFVAAVNAAAILGATVAMNTINPRVIQFAFTLTDPAHDKVVCGVHGPSRSGGEPELKASVAVKNGKHVITFTGTVQAPHIGVLVDMEGSSGLAATFG